MDAVQIEISPDILRLVAAIDEFKGEWRALQNIAPDRLSLLRKVATIESVGSSTRIEGARLTDGEVERLLSAMRVSPRIYEFLLESRLHAGASRLLHQKEHA